MNATEDSFASDAVAGLWGDARLVVVDTETVRHDKELRAVSLAAVTCRAGFVRGKWQTLIDPGVPVDEDSVRVHGLTQDHLDGEPPFEEVAEQLLAALEPAGEEPVVLAAHNVAFDVTVLRGELARCGLDLPELPVLDTMGRLPSLVDVKPAARHLQALCEALDVTHERAHDALYDAVMCAEALVALLARAAADGHHDLSALIHRVPGDTTTHTLEPVDPTKLFRTVRRDELPGEHLASHSKLLSARAGRRMLEGWRGGIAECSRLRCRHLDDRVANAGPSAEKLLPVLHSVLDELVGADDVAGTATLLGAALPVLDALPPHRGRLGFRNAVLEWGSSWGPRLTNLGRCANKDLCPACQRGEACPLDTWPDRLAKLALGDGEGTVRRFFETTGAEAGTGTYTEWCRRGLHLVGDAAVWLCVCHWRAVGQDTRADQVAQQSWQVGCRHPDVVDAYASKVGYAGGPADLRTAIDVCDEALASATGSTHDGWVRLEARRNQLAGRAQRLTSRPSRRLDPDGNPIPVRLHHPTNPKRIRPPRFARK